MTPASAEELKLHRRLVEGDLTVLAELCDRYVTDLTRNLAHRYGRIALHDRGLVSSAVTDAVLDYVSDPARYRPTGQSLLGYLRMSAAGDLLNLWRKVPSPEKVGLVGSLDDLLERGVCPVCDVVGHLPEVDVCHDTVRALCLAWRALLAKLTDIGPARLVQHLDESVALLSKSGNHVVGDERALGFWVPCDWVLLDFWRRVCELVPDCRERQVFALMLCGVRATCQYASVLGVSRLPVGQQRKEVKRVKDRLVKRLQRADWRDIEK